MGKRFHYAALLLALAGSSAVADLNQDEVLRLRQRGVVVAFEVLLQDIQDRYPDAVLLDTELEEDDARLIYELEILTADRTVRELKFDARNGRLLQDELED